MNSEALRKPKLQADMFFILVRFRKEIVVLKGDISPMYHQLALKLEGQTTTQVSMEDLDQSKEPEV